MKKALMAGITLFLLALPLMLVLSILEAVPIWLLWNWVGPAVLHAPELAFWHVWGLLLLYFLVTHRSTTGKG
jgi:hypothetical protein